MKSFGDRRKEYSVIEHRGTGGFGSSAQDDDDQVFSRIDIELLAEDSPGFKGAAVDGFIGRSK